MSKDFKDLKGLSPTIIFSCLYEILLILRQKYSDSSIIIIKDRMYVKSLSMSFAFSKDFKDLKDCCLQPVFLAWLKSY